MAEQNILTAEQAALLQASGIPIINSTDTNLAHSLEEQHQQQLNAVQLQQAQTILDPQQQRLMYVGYSYDILTQIVDNLRNVESGFAQFQNFDATAANSYTTHPDGTTTLSSSSSSSSSSTSDEDKKFVDGCIDTTRKLAEHADSLVKSIMNHFPTMITNRANNLSALGMKTDMHGQLTTTDNLLDMNAYSNIALGMMPYTLGLNAMPLGVTTSSRKKARYDGDGDDPNSIKRRRSHTHYVCTLCSLGPDGEPRDMQGKRNVRIHFHSKQNDHREQYIRENRAVVEQLVAHGQPPIVIFAGVDTCLSCRGDPKVDDHTQCLGNLIQFLHSIGAQILPGPSNTMGLSLMDNGNANTV